MLWLLLGLALFLSTHSIRIFAENERTTRIAAIGEQRWKMVYSVVSLIGFVLIVVGYGAARLDPVYLWYPPMWTRHLAALLTLPAFILLVAAYVPGNRLKVWFGHPMVLGVKFWALSHLISNGTLADVLLFGSFLVWAALSYRAARQRDRAAGVRRQPAGLARDALTVGIGGVAWVVFALWLHALLIGIRPFG